jgi:single-strand DNA-binding protein
MASLCKVLLMGNLGADPEMRYMPNGDAVCNCRIATTEQWKDKSTGEKKESTEWTSLVFFRRLAEIAGEYLKKGTSIYVEGRLKTRKWQDKDGHDRYTTEVHVHELKILSGRKDGEGAHGTAGGTSKQPSSKTQQEKKPAQDSSGGFNDFEDDIPF